MREQLFTIFGKIWQGYGFGIGMGVGLGLVRHAEKEFEKFSDAKKIRDMER